MTAADLAREVRQELEPRRQEMVDLLGRLVSIESPSDNLAALARFAAAIEEMFKELGSFELKGIAGPQRVFG